MLCSKLDSQPGTVITSLFAAYLWMMNHGGIISITALGINHIAIDNIRILTMRHYGQTGRRERIISQTERNGSGLASRGSVWRKLSK